MDKNNNTYKGLITEEEYKAVWWLIKKYQTNCPTLRRVDTKELMQRCMVKYSNDIKKYDPAKGKSKKNYMLMTIKTNLIDILNEMIAKKRGPEYKTKSLEASVGNEDDSLTISETITSNLNEEEDLILKIEIKRVSAKLSERQKAILDCKKRNISESTIGKQLGIHRDTVYEETKRIEEIFNDNGLKEYLK